MNTELSPLEAATNPDGFIHFYKLLDLEAGANDRDVTDRINALYQEAQINRDHRVAARRREYQTLLEILPQARTVLLDETRRKRYNAYLKAVEMDLPRMTFPEFFEGLLRERGAAKEQMDILAIRDLSRLRSTSATSDETPKTETPKIEAPKKLASPVAEIALPTENAPTNQTASPIETDSPSQSRPSNPLLAPQSLVGAGVVFAGMLATLPSMALVPVPIAGALALLCAGVTAYVFSQASEPGEIA